MHFKNLQRTAKVHFKNFYLPLTDCHAVSKFFLIKFNVVFCSYNDINVQSLPTFRSPFAIAVRQSHCFSFLSGAFVYLLISDH